MSDLLENLKNADPYADPDHVCDLIVDVVDEIERLRAALEKMQRGRDRYREAWEAEKARAALAGG